MSKRNVAISVTAVCAMLIILYELVLSKLICSSLDGVICRLVDMTVTRALGAAIFIAMLAYLGYKVLNPIKAPFFTSIAFCLPAFAVAINNFPFSCIINGKANVDLIYGKVILLLAECLAVALFEEFAFRGVVLLGFAEKRRDSRKGLFIAIVLSSAVFGAVHMLNIFTSSPIAVFMQIGYSFLIGGMCSVVLLKTANIWLCVVIHATFNFCGAIVPTFGVGEIWDSFTVILTAIIAVLTFVYMLVSFLRLDVEEIERIYVKEPKGEVNERN